MDVTIKNKNDTTEKVTNDKKINSKKKKDTNIIIFNGKSIKNNNVQIEGFSFRLLGEDIKENVKIEYVKNNGNVEIIKIN